MSTATEDSQLEVIDTGAIGQIERAQIDMQIATARRYPRSLSQVKAKMLTFATLDQETAQSCFYTLPARKGGDGKPLQGPSVRMAEIALSCFQHIRAGSRIIEDNGKFITAQGVVHDLENNVVVSIEVKRRVTNREGKRYSDDMIATTGNAACSIALRNAAFRVVPAALIKPVYDAARKLAIGDAKSLVQRRAQAVEHFGKMGVSKEQIAAALSLRSVEDIGLEHLETLLGFSTSIKDGAATIDEIFGKEKTVRPASVVEPIQPFATPAEETPEAAQPTVATTEEQDEQGFKF